jgi:hypothetical protein
MVCVITQLRQSNQIQLVLNVLPYALLKIKVRPFLNGKLLLSNRYCELPLVGRM